MTYEITSVALGKTSVWTVEAKNMSEARKLAHERLRTVARGDIVGVRPVGYKPKD